MRAKSTRKSHQKRWAQRQIQKTRRSSSKNIARCLEMYSSGSPDGLLPYAPTSVQFPYLVDDEDSSFQESFSEPQENALTKTGQIFNVKWKNTVITPALKLKNLYTWCHMGIQRSFQFAADTLFPARQYKSQLEKTVQRLQFLEEELNRIKQQQEQQTNQQSCQCICKSSVNSGKSAMPVTRLSMVPPPPPMLAPPPPPPPPPPPMTATIDPMLALKEAVGKNKGKGLSNKKENKIPVICLKDIKNVKLRSVGDRPTANQKKVNKSGPLVSLDDLKKISLKKIHKDAQNQNVLDEVRRRLPVEVLQFQRKLRKVNLRRSPGGTPMVDKKQRLESGTGLTPVMTRALKKKFLFARTPSPKSRESSPCSRKNSPAPMTGVGRQSPARSRQPLHDLHKNINKMSPLLQNN